ncbi:MAG: substrate-binding domain-containing protein, partial [Cohaesibacter sp.]|nr:substrate-binding domain-containing protein [Cohaesibacter sp.]
PGFPNSKIRVYGPPMTSGTRDVFVHLVMNSGCDSLPVTAKDFVVQDVCGHIREDGVYINAAEDDAMMVKRLINDPNAIGIMGYGALKRHKGQIQGLPIEGIKPGDETLEGGRYPLSRPLYIYVKTAHAGRVNGLMDYVGQLLSDENIGFDGDLPTLGLIPMQDNEKFFVQSSYKALLERLNK